MTINLDLLVLSWLALSNALTFLLFGYDKRQARQTGHRVPEYQLTLWAAMGGWPAGLIAMLFFRHKTSKPLFLFKYGVAFLIWSFLGYGYWMARH